MNTETNTIASPTRHGRAARQGDGSAAPRPDSLVRKGDAGKLVVRCPRCKLNVKIARQEIPDE